jgi:hypothetical protein
VFQNIDQQQRHRRGLTRSRPAEHHHSRPLAIETVVELLTQLRHYSGGQHPAR